MSENIAQKAVILVGNKADLARSRTITTEGKTINNWKMPKRYLQFTKLLYDARGNNFWLLYLITELCESSTLGGIPKKHLQKTHRKHEKSLKVLLDVATNYS